MPTGSRGASTGVTKVRSKFTTNNFGSTQILEESGTTPLAGIITNNLHALPGIVDTSPDVKHKGLDQSHSGHSF